LDHCKIKKISKNKKEHKNRTFIERKTLSCLWNSKRTETRSDLSKRETLDRTNRSKRTGSVWSLFSSLVMMRPSFPSSFFRLHIDRLGLEAEPVMNREQEEELRMVAVEEEDDDEETLRSATRNIKVSKL